MEDCEGIILWDGREWQRTGGNYYILRERHGKRTGEMLHRAIWEKHFGKIPANHVVHHKDHNPDNNDISNLVCIPRVEHQRAHMLERGEWIKENLEKKARPALHEWQKSAEGQKRMSEVGKALQKRNMETLIKEAVCKECGARYTTNIATSTGLCRKCGKRAAAKRHYERNKEKLLVKAEDRAYREALCKECGTKYTTVISRTTGLCPKCGKKLQTGEATKNEKAAKTVYNIETRKSHLYYANGILVHNCNLKDRISRAEREHTKQVYMELQNIKNRGGKIINTGTPWHKDDAFSLMPPARTFDCYTTGLMTAEEISEVRSKTAPSLFAANYELKHIASEQALFTAAPRFTSDASKLYDGIAHIDAAYGGEDGNALTLAKKGRDIDGKEVIYLLGKRREGHIDNCLREFMLIKNQYRCGYVLTEKNADKGYLAKEIQRLGEIPATYHEKMNKYMKIATHLRGNWSKIIFLEGTDPEYINEIMDYTEDAEHDDAPDSAASIIMQRFSDKGKIQFA